MLRRFELFCNSTFSIYRSILKIERIEMEKFVKEILKDTRINVVWGEKDTLYSLIKSITKAFKLTAEVGMPDEIKTISTSLLGACKAIEDLRSSKTIFHGKMDSNYIISDSLYAYFIVNAVSTVGLFLLNFYKVKYPPIVQPTIDVDDLPF